MPSKAGRVAREEIDLQAGSEAHFLVDLRDLAVQAGIEFSEHVVFALERIDDRSRGGETGEASGELVGIAME